MVTELYDGPKGAYRSLSDFLKLLHIPGEEAFVPNWNRCKSKINITMFLYLRVILSIKMLLVGNIS